MPLPAMASTSPRQRGRAAARRRSWWSPAETRPATRTARHPGPLTLEFTPEAEIHARIARARRRLSDHGHGAHDHPVEVVEELEAGTSPIAPLAEPPLLF